MDSLKQKASIGPNIRQLIVFQNTVQQLSFSQILDFSQNCLNFPLAEGEITNILAEQATKLKPAFEDLKQAVRGQPAVNFDETGWLLQEDIPFGGDYVWVMADAKSSDVIYRFGKHRGGANIRELIGEDFNGIGISDDYPGYTNSFKKGKHALCWAHPMRKFRDLKNSKNLAQEKKKQCENFYQKFSSLYKKADEVSQEPFDKTTRKQAKEKLMHEFERILRLNKDDPIKLKTIKETLLKKKERYFLCITEPNIPPDNNKAERALRHLVIKRKKSFGSKTTKGADIMSVIYSVVMSLWNRSKGDFFKNYAKAIESATAT